MLFDQITFLLSP